MSVKSRRPAREAALRALYEVEIGKSSSNDALEFMEAYQSLSDDLAAYARKLVLGVMQCQRDIDARLQAKLIDWDLGRMATVDRNVLRIGAYELLHCPDVPPRVTLDEVIEIAKKYSTAESGKFVNGVLAAFLKDTDKADWTAPEDDEATEEPAAPEPEPEIEAINEDTPEAAELARVGKWKLRSEDAPV